MTKDEALAYFESGETADLVRGLQAGHVLAAEVRAQQSPISFSEVLLREPKPQKGGPCETCRYAARDADHCDVLGDGAQALTEGGCWSWEAKEGGDAQD